MINRVLIRIKVVQLLYSYLLSDNTFSLESQPSNPTKEKRFAYSLYMDLLVLMCRVAERVKTKGESYPLSHTRFIGRVRQNESLQSLMQRYRVEGFPFENVTDRLAESVKESALYKNFRKAEHPDEGIWREIFRIIIMADPLLKSEMERRANYTLRGIDRMREMMEDTFTNFFAAQDTTDMALKTLERSMDKSRELYFRLLLLPVGLTELRAQQLEENRTKYIVSDEDLNPNLKFVENGLIDRIRRALCADSAIEKEVGALAISWNLEEPVMMRALLKDIIASEAYQRYMESPRRDIKEDTELWRELFKHVIFQSPDFLETLEDKSVFWNDDVDIVGTFLLKTLKRLGQGDGDACGVMPMYKDEEDARFGAELFGDVVANRQEYRGMIDRYVDRKIWESERLAYMDVVVVMTALAELLNFPKIPVNVSINEYVEIAKAYSTPRSGGFVHGLLASITRNLQEEGILNK